VHNTCGYQSAEHLKIEGTRGRGKNKCVEVVEKDMNALGLKKTDV